MKNALSSEIDRISKKLGAVGLDRTRTGSLRRGRGQLKFLVAQKCKALGQQWLQYAEADKNIRRIKLSGKRRVIPVMPVVEEALGSMNLSLQEIVAHPMKAASRHGKERRKQGYTPTTLLEEYNLIRRCIHKVAEQNLPQLDPELLLRDLGQLGEVLDLQSQHAIRGFLGQA